MPKALEVEMKKITLNVSMLAREAGLSEAVAESTALLAFASRVVDIVMAANGAQRRDNGGH